MGWGVAGYALGNCEDLGYLYGSFRVILETRFASGSAQTIQDDLPHFAKSYHQTLPMLPRGIPRHPPPHRNCPFFTSHPGGILFLGYIGRYFSPETSHRMCCRRRRITHPDYHVRHLMTLKPQGL